MLFSKQKEKCQKEMATKKKAMIQDRGPQEPIYIKVVSSIGKKRPLLYS